MYIQKYVLIFNQNVSNKSEIIVHKHKLSLLFFTLSSLVLWGCGSTSNTTPNDTQPTDNESTEDDDGRGFDPCLINPKLAVCNKESSKNSDKK